MIVEAREHTNSNHTSFEALQRQVIECSKQVDEPNDILQANTYFRAFPSLIASRDISTILRVTREDLAPRVDAGIERMTDTEAEIAHRDFTMSVTASVLVPHNEGDQAGAYSDCGTIPEVRGVIGDFATDVLLRISKRVGRSARSDDENYAGSHSRRFTDTTIEIGGQQAYAEDVLKVTVGKGIETQEQALQNLVELTSISEVNSPEFRSVLSQVAVDFSMLASLAVFRHHVPKEYFMRVLSPLFKQYSVDGRVLAHSGARLSSMPPMDDSFWRKDKSDPRFADYQLKHTADASFTQKLKHFTIRQNMFGKLSFINQILEQIPNPALASDDELKTAVGIHSFMVNLAAFRNAHANAIRETLNLRENTTGTGGSLEVAFLLNEQTAIQRDLLKPYAIEWRKRSEKLEVSDRPQVVGL